MMRPVEPVMASSTRADVASGDVQSPPDCAGGAAEGDPPRRALDRFVACPAAGVLARVRRYHGTALARLGHQLGRRRLVV